MFLTQNDVRTLRQIRSYLQTTTKHPVSVTDLMAQYGMKESKLTKGFKQLYHIAIHEYYLQCSMERAKEMLKSGAQVKEVAITFGYSTSGSFSRAFTKLYGFTPGSIKVQQ